MTPDLFQHVLNVLEDDAIRAAVSTSLRKIGTVFSRAVGRPEAIATELGDPRMLEIELERIDNAVGVIRVELEALTKSRSTNWEAIDRNTSEPAFASFTDRAVSHIAEATIESKRAVLAAMIVRRLELQANSGEEVLLRRASEVVPFLSERQLLLLAAILLVKYFPGDEVAIQFATRDEAEAWLREQHFTVARRLKNTGHWRLEDFEMLVAFGAIRLTNNILSLSGSGPFVDTAVAGSALYQWLLRKGVSPYEGFEGKIGSPESQAAYGRRYPTIRLLSKLANGEYRGTSRGIKLDNDVHFTPVGEYLAAMIYERLTGYRVEKAVLMQKTIAPAQEETVETSAH